MGEKEGGNSFLIGFILGAIAGVAVGFLYAPKPGKETRAMLREKASEFKEKAGEVISRATKEMGRG
jgi:gas vesicle protein